MSSDTQSAPGSPQAAKGEPLVVLSGVNKWFGDLHVLKDIDVTVKRGEVVVVIGPSGSGKSTLCRAINRLETIGEGTITLDGVPLPEEGKELAKLRAEVGMVFQSFNLFAHKTILQNVTLGPTKVRKKKRADAEKRANELLERVGVGHHHAVSRRNGVSGNQLSSRGDRGHNLRRIELFTGRDIGEPRRWRQRGGKCRVAGHRRGTRY